MNASNHIAIFTAFLIDHTDDLAVIPYIDAANKLTIIDGVDEVKLTIETDVNTTTIHIMVDSNGVTQSISVGIDSDGAVVCGNIAIL